MRLSPEHVREKLQSDRTEISGEKRERERVRNSTLDIGVADRLCRVSVGGGGGGGGEAICVWRGACHHCCAQSPGFPAADR